jgi:hypothetical protein
MKNKPSDAGSTRSEMTAKKITRRLKDEQQKIEELILQLSLGKSEASEVFEDIKKRFRKRISDFKRLHIDKTGEATENSLGFLLDELMLRISLGKSEAADSFLRQKRKILKAIHEIENKIKEDKALEEIALELKLETELFRIKTEIVTLKVSNYALITSDKIKHVLSLASGKINKLSEVMLKKWNGTNTKYSDFSREIDFALRHFKNSVKVLKNDQHDFKIINH